MNRFSIVLLSSVILYVVLNVNAFSQVKAAQELYHLEVRDNLYSKAQATFLDSTRYRPGALVVGLPQGVVSWYAQFPIDTINRFTWRGGDAHLLPLDINGDGLRDFVDSKGNLYVSGHGPWPDSLYRELGLATGYIAVGDLNQDGLDDIVNVSYIKSIVSVVLGHREIDSISQKSSTSEYLDSVNFPLASFSTSGGGLNLVCRHYQYIVDQRGEMRLTADGIRLINVRSAVNAGAVITKLLVDTSWAVSNTVGELWAFKLRSVQSRNSMFLSTKNSNRVGDIKLSIVDIDSNLFIPIRDYLVDSLVRVECLNHSVDDDDVPDVLVTRVNNFKSDLYSLNSMMELREIAELSLFPTASAFSFAASGSLLFNGIAGYGTYTKGAHVYTVLSLLRVVDSTVNLVPTSHNSLSTKISITPNPVQSSGVIDVAFTVTNPGLYTASINTYSGKQTYIGSQLQYDIGVRHLRLDIAACGLQPGVYCLNMTDGTTTHSANFIVE